MKKIFFASLIIFLISPKITIQSQDTDLRELFLAAESYFLFEEFNEALPLYLRIHRHYPDNDNINYKIGVCYLNDPYQKNKSMHYLEQAAENINPKYRDNNFKEEAAPLDALFYLGNAYRVNNQLDKAKEYYNLFLTRIDPEVYDAQLVKEQIEACEAAEKMMQKPIDFDAENLSNRINTRFADENPVVSGDETKMAFISKLQFYDAVFYTEKVNGEWTPPRNIVPELGVDGDVYPTSLSYNGTEMFIYRNDDFIGNLYYSQLVNGKWTPIRKLGDNINTKYWESHASLSKDGKTLYFSSNRKGGFGGLDVYRSIRQENGEWGPAINLGPMVNTKYNDDTPFITDTDDRLFFSSYGHYNMGGYDIFMTMKIDSGKWSKPVNIGYPINTTDDDQFFNPVRGGQVAYYSRYDMKSGLGKNDIYRFEIYSPDNPRLFAIEGLIDYQGVEVDSNEVDISVIDVASNDTVNFLNPDSKGSFRFKVPEGNYDVVFDSEKFNREILKLQVSPNTPKKGIVLAAPVVLGLLPVLTDEEQQELDELLTIKEDSVIYAFEGEDVKIRFNAEKGSTVVVGVFNDSVLINSDTMEINRRRQSFEFQPQPGTNEVQLTLTDEEGNLVSKGVKVIVPVVSPPDISDDEGIIADSIDMEDELRSEKTDIQRKIDILKDNSSGALKEYLEDLDPSAEGIKNIESLIDHLMIAGAIAGFTSAAIDSMLLDSGLMDELDLFIRDLSRVSAPALEKYLRQLEPENFGIENKNQLIQHLYDNAESEDYTSKEVTDALSKLLGPNNMEKLILELQDHTSGPLKDYLSDLDPVLLDITTLEELMEHLIENATENGFTEQDVLDMFESYFSDDEDYFLELFKKLKENAEGDTKEFLEGIDESDIKGLKRKEFYNLLFDRADAIKLDPTDLIGLALGLEKINPDHLNTYLQKYGSEGLKNSLLNLPENVTTADDLFYYLIEQAEINDEVNEENIISFHKDYLKNKDVYDLYFDLLKNSDDELKSFLENLDIREMQFGSTSLLIEYLLNNSESAEYTKDDIFEALSQSYKNKQIEDIIEDLIRLSEGGLRNALEELDPYKSNIRSLGDIVNYLMDNREKYNYTEEDVIDLILRYLNSEYPEDSIDEDLVSDQKEGKEKFNRGVRLTVAILLLEGLLILILILLARRKKKKKEEQE